MPLTLSPKVRYPSPVRAWNQILRRRAAAARRAPTDPAAAGLTVAQVGENVRAFTAAMGTSVSLLKPFPTDRTRCEACGLLDDDCRCTWNAA